MPAPDESLVVWCCPGILGGKWREIFLVLLIGRSNRSTCHTLGGCGVLLEAQELFPKGFRGVVGGIDRLWRK
jgi:hypothetical protein